MQCDSLGKKLTTHTINASVTFNNDSGATFESDYDKVYGVSIIYTYDCYVYKLRAYVVGNNKIVFFGENCSGKTLNMAFCVFTTE